MEEKRQSVFVDKSPEKSELTPGVFLPNVLNEESALCNILDTTYKTKLSDIARAIDQETGNVFAQKISGYTILETWNLFVCDGQRTWRNLYDLFLRHGCQEAGRQLKIVYEKNVLVSELENLQHDLSIALLISSLLMKTVMTDTDLAVINRVSEEEATRYLVMNMLVPRDHKYIALFHEILRDECQEDWAKKLALCPEDL